MKLVIVILVILLLGVGMLFQYWGEHSTGGGEDMEMPEGSAPAKALPPTPMPKIDEAKFVTTTSGLQYQDLKVGTGSCPKKGSTVSVHYTGWLKNGTKFDSSLDRKQPFEFKIGAGMVIKGWDEGVAEMKVGGKRILVIPSNLGYGESGMGEKIPPNSTLVFEIELLNTK